jgi:hypothetical protein
MDMLDAVLGVLCALGWLATYILIIWRGYSEKTYGMPLVALGVNIAWEFVFAFVIRPANTSEMDWLWIGISITWLLLDLVILSQVLRYGLQEKWPSKSFFYGAMAVSLVFGLWGVLALTFQFQDWEGRWSSLASNLMMSVLFINMLYQRGIRGQSIYIGLAKLIGTLFVGVGYLLDNPAAPLQWYLSLSILFFDMLYIVLLYRKIRATNLNPWTRL